MNHNLYELQKAVERHLKLLKKGKKKLYSDIGSLEFKKSEWKQGSFEYVRSLNCFTGTADILLRIPDTEDFNASSPLEKLARNKELLRVCSEHENEIHSFLYLQRWFSPFRKSVRNFSIIIHESAEDYYPEDGLKWILLKIRFIILLPLLFEELKKEKLFKIRLQRGFSSETVRVLLQYPLCSILRQFPSVLSEGLNQYFKRNLDSLINIKKMNSDRDTAKTSVSEKELKIRLERNLFQTVRNLIIKTNTKKILKM